MQVLQQELNQRQLQFSAHPFFSYLKEATDIKPLQNMSPHLAFWVMAFQDVLRLNEKYITTPYLRNIAKHHRLEDANHDKWFFEDILCLSQDRSYDFTWCFDPQNNVVRDVSYRIVSEIFHLDDEHLRIVLLLSLEAYGHIFFENIAGYVEKVGYGKKLKYFSKVHLDVEKAHSLYESKMEEELFKVKLSQPIQQKGLLLVDRIYNEMMTMFDNLLVSSQLKTMTKTTDHDLEHEYS